MTRICAGIYYYTVNSPQTPLPVLSTRLRTEIVDLTATHTLTQIFGNPILADSPDKALPISEAKYTFPLYESCAVTSFTAQIGTKLIQGVVKPKAEAKAVYAAAKQAGKQAALFEQNTGEVFTTSVGNIPAGSFVVVVIKYVHELKQDLEVEGVRLVVPTIIAPKYGWISPDNGLYQEGWGKKWNVMTKELEEACGGIPQAHGISMEILATMNGSIRGIQSPSHPISVDIGIHATGSDAFSPHKARATLALNATSLTGLDKDFTLIVNSTEMANPRAFLAPHPSLPDTSTLMVTLVPKFVLPQQCQEIVFIVDRSGSMYDKISTLKSALHLFLASLPVGTYFNIVSFGNSYSFLWNSSQLYNEETLKTAKKHVDSMDASFGGTEMYEPVKETVDRRRKELNTEVLVLTDGEIWHTETLFKYIGGAAEEGKVRFFSLGVGASVSHLLVEGISRAGKGYSQLVGDGENMQKKVMRMLKAALTPHVNDWSVDWEGKAAQLAEFSDSQAKPDAVVVKPAISLFDQASTPDDPPAAEPLAAANRPPVLQAPSSIPPLFAFTRTTVYYILSTSPTPTTVTLCGSAHDTNTNTIQPLSLSLPVTLITSPFTCRGLYSLAGRKILQDLEEFRCSYLPKDAHPAQIEAEGARLGVQFNLASKWTSFVAVAEDGDQSAEDTAPPPKASLEQQVTMVRGGAMPHGGYAMSSAGARGGMLRGSFARGGGGGGGRGGGGRGGYDRITGGSAVVRSMACSSSPSPPAQPPSAQSVIKESLGHKKKVSRGIPNPSPFASVSTAGSKSSSLFGAPSGSIGPSPFAAASQSSSNSSGVQSAGLFGGAPPSTFGVSSFGTGAFGATPSPPEASSGLFGTLSGFGGSFQSSRKSDAPPIKQHPAPSRSALSEGEDEAEEEEEEIFPENGDVIGLLSRLQQFSGYFNMSKQLLKLLGYSEKQINTVGTKLGIIWTDREKKAALMTLLVLAHLDTKLKDSEEEWELMADKARAHLKEKLEAEEMEMMKVEVQKLVDGLALE
ncbi:hypothetical protein Q9L58_006427 [Maublancomyces gigas]|uniref:Uncharacterized protein n=1 Tax=Discina gigas TaxID=1032678 RepID=A0ABR3GFC5_9PEZI